MRRSTGRQAVSGACMHACMCASECVSRDRSCAAACRYTPNRIVTGSDTATFTLCTRGNSPDNKGGGQLCVSVTISVSAANLVLGAAKTAVP